jgi:hypothetical protein
MESTSDLPLLPPEIIDYISTFTDLVTKTRIGLIARQYQYIGEEPRAAARTLRKYIQKVKKYGKLYLYPDNAQARLLTFMVKDWYLRGFYNDDLSSRLRKHAGHRYFPSVDFDCLTHLSPDGKLRQGHVIKPDVIRYCLTALRIEDPLIEFVFLLTNDNILQIGRDPPRDLDTFTASRLVHTFESDTFLQDKAVLYDFGFYAIPEICWGALYDAYKVCYTRGVTAELFDYCMRTNRLDELLLKKCVGAPEYKKWVHMGLTVGPTYTPEDDTPEEDIVEIMGHFASPRPPLYLAGNAHTFDDLGYNSPWVPNAFGDLCKKERDDDQPPCGDYMPRRGLLCGGRYYNISRAVLISSESSGRSRPP